MGLLVATSAAFAITEHLKGEKSPLYAVQVSAGAAPPLHGGLPVVISPVCHCSTSVTRIGFELRHPDRVTVSVVDEDGNTVWTHPEELLGAHVSQHVTWDGRTDSGGRVPDGVYNPSVYLANERHGFQFANKITVDTKPPVNVSQPTVLKPVLLAGPGRSVAIKYDFDEKAHALVYLDGRQIIAGHKSAQQAKIKWNGRLDHRPLPAGTYVLSIGARDLAGNETPVGGRKQVTVVLRYIAVTPGLIRVRSGRPFRVQVETASRHYTWRLGLRHGERRRKTLRLRAPSTPGRYRLVVAQNGHTATAFVRVHR
jgi:hypothetical protein